MNTEALEYFIKVYEKKSITGAAKDLYITPQGISKMIKQLEMELETELFVRGPRGMEASEAGELLYARAKHISYLMEDIKKEINIISGKKGVLNVAVNYSTTLFLPVDYLYRFSEVYPDIRIKVREYPDQYQISELFQDDADVSLVLAHDDIENYKYDLISSGEIVAVVSKNHALAKRDEISVLDLENEPLVIKPIDNDKEHGFLAKCLENGFTPKIKHEFGSVITAHRMCERIGTVAISVDFVEEEYGNPNLKIIRLKEKMTQNIYLVVRKSGIESKAITLFQHYIKDLQRSF